MAAIVASLDIGMEQFFAILNLYVTPMPPIEFKLNPTYGLEEMSFEEFQDGHFSGHTGYQYGMIWAILNLHVVKMPPTKF